MTIMKKFKPGYDDGMWKGAPEDSFSKERYLRHFATDAEKFLGEHLGANELRGLKFRRQHPIDIYIADFYFHQLKLIIGIDGAFHCTKEQFEKLG